MALQLRNYSAPIMYGAAIEANDFRFADLAEIDDANGNEMLEMDTVTSAVNFFRMANSITTAAPVLSAQGDDANVGMTLTMKGTGTLTLSAGATTTVAYDIVGTSITEGKGVDLSDLTALTSGIGVHIASAATAITGAGRLIYTNHTGATTTSGTLNEFATSANDETILFKLTGASITTGTAFAATGFDALTSGIIGSITSAATAITGAGRMFSVSHTGVTSTSGTLVEFVSLANDETILFKLTAASLTTGTAAAFTGFDALTSGIGLSVSSAATAITGAGRLIYSNHTGVSGTSAILNEFTSANTDETIVFKVTASAATTGKVEQVSATATVTGIIHETLATAATLTTGRYYSANDAAGEVFGVGTNGHIISTVSASVPTIAVSQQNGITAAAITAGGSDTAGIITTTGTNNNAGTSILQVTFGKTYTSAPKAVLLFPRNAAAGKAALAADASPGQSAYVSATAATTFDITIPASATAVATPSWNYVVIA